jgi:histidyl-tRNA synthetase
LRRRFAQGRDEKADKSGAAVALIIGEQELAAGQVLVKPLRSGDEQLPLEQSALNERLMDIVAAQRD